MDIHKPKPAHSLREFFSEISIVVLGILIALSAEQAVEALHSHHLVEQADRAMEREINDGGQQAYARLAISPCLSRHLDALRAAVGKRVAPDAFGKLATTYVPPIRSWDDVAWRSAQSSGVVSRMGALKLNRWSQAYSMIPFLERAQEAEGDALSQLNRSRYKTGAWTQARADELDDLVDEFDSINERMSLDAAQQLFNMNEIGMALNPAVEKKLLAEMRGAYGDCAVEPNLTAIRSLQSQVQTPEQRQDIMKRLTGH